MGWVKINGVVEHLAKNLVKIGKNGLKIGFLVHFLAKFVLLEISKLKNHKQVGSN